MAGGAGGRAGPAPPVRKGEAGPGALIAALAKDQAGPTRLAPRPPQARRRGSVIGTSPTVSAMAGARARAQATLAVGPVTPHGPSGRSSRVSSAASFSRPEEPTATHGPPRGARPGAGVALSDGPTSVAPTASTVALLTSSEGAGPCRRAYIAGPTPTQAPDAPASRATVGVGPGPCVKGRPLTIAGPSTAGAALAAATPPPTLTTALVTAVGRRFRAARTSIDFGGTSQDTGKITRRRSHDGATKVVAPLIRAGASPSTTAGLAAPVPVPGGRPCEGRGASRASVGRARP